MNAPETVAMGSEDGAKVVSISSVAVGLRVGALPSVGSGVGSTAGAPGEAPVGGALVAVASVGASVESLVVWFFWFVWLLIFEPILLCSPPPQMQHALFAVSPF